MSVDDVSVAVPVPYLDRLTYRMAPGHMAPPIGARVVVPLGSRVVTGIVMDHLTSDGGQAAEGEIKSVVEVLDSEPFVPERVLSLTTWVAEYYACGAGDAIAAALPPRWAARTERVVTLTARGRERLDRVGAGAREDPVETVLQAIATGGPLPPAKARRLKALEAEGLVSVHWQVQRAAGTARTVRVASVTAAGHALLGPGDGVAAEAARVTPAQVSALKRIAGVPGGLTVPDLVRTGVSRAVLQRLIAGGFASIRLDRVERDPFAGAGADFDEVGPVDGRPTVEQAEALDRLQGRIAEGGFHVALLHGVTGSGKTEVYVRLARQTLDAGRTVLVLVPEIALTTVVAARFRAVFGRQVTIQHSGLSIGERYDQWERVRCGDVSIVVGTRSAVFAPLDRIGLIVVDEEHDASFKQDETPRYHGRDVAVMRGKQAGALVVLGSATPAVETYQHALEGRYELLVMARRVEDRPLASVHLVPMRDEYATDGPDVILSRELVERIDDRLGRGQQILLLLNRRGLARSVFCRQCTGPIECPNCSVSLTVHGRARGGSVSLTGSPGGLRGRCHYCNYAITIPPACPHCAGPYLERAGFGSERVEAEVRLRWPAVEVARLDRDVARRKGAAARVLRSFARGECAVLVGTQMIAKGHDFPNVTLVGVVSADVGLGLADFRAAERTFQLLTQVVGRAGRGVQAGEAVIQTLYPNHYSIRHARRQDYAAFHAEEMAYRRAMRYPPTVSLVNVILRAPTLTQGLEEAEDVVRGLRARARGAFVVLGPAPAPLGRLRGEYRVQWFMKGSRRAAMRRQLLEALREHPSLDKRTTVDIDPVSML